MMLDDADILLRFLRRAQAELGLSDIEFLFLIHSWAGIQLSDLSEADRELYQELVDAASKGG